MIFQTHRRALPKSRHQHHGSLLERLESRLLMDVTFNIDTTAGLKAISPYIYGTNYGQLSAFTGYTFARVGRTLEVVQHQVPGRRRVALAIDALKVAGARKSRTLGRHGPAG